MSRLIDYDPRRGLLLVQFPYDKWLVEVVKGLPGRRWDAMGRVWVLPGAQLGVVMGALSEYGFELTGEAAALLASGAAVGTVGARAAAPASPAAREASGGVRPPDLQGALAQAVALIEAGRSGAASAAASGAQGALADATARERADTLRVDGANTFTVSAVNQRARQVLRAAFPEAFWVVGELSGYVRARERRFMSFELLERPAPDADPTAHIQAVVKADARAVLERRLEEASAGFGLQDGLQVRLKVSVDLYPEYGKFQLQVLDIDPAFTLNQLAVRRDEILRQLAAQDLLHLNRDMPLPWLPLRVALITSPQGEAVQDFLHELSRSGVGFDVSLFGVRVQGPRLAPELTAALAAIRRHPDRFDAVVIIRGGGSRADLAWFDHLDIARAVATCPLKVIVGIGHHRDQSVLDLIAHSEKTPTAAAERLVRCVEEAVQQQDALLQTLLTRAQASIISSAHQLNRHANALAVASRRRLATTSQGLARAQATLSTSAQRALERAQDALSATSIHLHANARAALRAEGSALAAATARLTSRHLPARFARASVALDAARDALRARALSPLRALSLRLEALELRRRLLDPLAAMARGFARVTLPNGQPLTSVRQPSPGDTLRVRLRDGALLTTVHAIHPDQPDQPNPPEQATQEAPHDDRPQQPVLPRGDAGAEAPARRHRGRRHRPG